MPLDMQTIDNPEHEFVSSFALQRQRLLHNVDAILGGDPPADPMVRQLSQTLLRSLELLKVAEEELRDERRTSATRSLVEERRLAHLTALFEMAPTPLLLTTTDTTIREGNQSAADLLGRNPALLTGLRLSDLVPAPQRMGFREHLAHAIELGTVAAWSFTLDVQRSFPAVVSSSLRLIDDAAMGTRALYWSLRAV
jgi:PAS domain S-box-containing protein